MKYYANYNANGGLTLKEPITGTDKKEIIKEIKKIAEGKRKKGGFCCWNVWCIKDEEYIDIAIGYMDTYGDRKRIL